MPPEPGFGSGASRKADHGDGHGYQRHAGEVGGPEPDPLECDAAQHRAHHAGQATG